MAGVLRRGAQDDIELRRELADPRAFDWRERDGDRLPGPVIADALVDPVTQISGVALDEQLGVVQAGWPARLTLNRMSRSRRFMCVPSVLREPGESTMERTGAPMAQQS